LTDRLFPALCVSDGVDPGNDRFPALQLLLRDLIHPPQERIRGELLSVQGSTEKSGKQWRQRRQSHRVLSGRIKNSTSGNCKILAAYARRTQNWRADFACMGMGRAMRTWIGFGGLALAVFKTIYLGNRRSDEFIQNGYIRPRVQFLRAAGRRFLPPA